MGCPYYTLTYLCVGQLPELIAWPEATWHCGSSGDLWGVLTPAFCPPHLALSWLNSLRQGEKADWGGPC